jgi:hypothetical protein
MGEIKIKIPERVMREFPEVEWSEVAERAVLEEFWTLASIKLFDELFKHSELTDEDCLKLGKEVNRAVRLRIEKELKEKQSRAKVFSTSDLISFLSVARP